MAKSEADRLREGLSLARARTRLGGVSQRQIAREAGVNHSFISRIERGAASAPPSVVSAYRTLCGYGEPLSYEEAARLWARETGGPPRGPHRLEAGPFVSNSPSHHKFVIKELSIELLIGPAGRIEQTRVVWCLSRRHSSAQDNPLDVVASWETLGSLYPRIESHETIRLAGETPFTLYLSSRAASWDSPSRSIWTVRSKDENISSDQLVGGITWEVRAPSLGRPADSLYVSPIDIDTIRDVRFILLQAHVSHRVLARRAKGSSYNHLFPQLDRDLIARTDNQGTLPRHEVSFSELHPKRAYGVKIYSSVDEAVEYEKYW